MAIAEIDFYSKALGRRVVFNVYLPESDESEPRQYTALLQLHGASDNHRSWLTMSKLAYYLERHRFIAIMPEGGLSYWANWRLRGPGTRYEDFIMDDLIPACERFFPIERGAWAIGGLSMGGYGALRLGLKHPDRFASIFAHSSVIPNRPQLQERFPGLGSSELDDANIYDFAQGAVSHENRPALGFDCGKDDALLPHNRAFHLYLNSIGYQHKYSEHPGGHSWEYWDEHVQRALQFHASECERRGGAE